MKGCDRGATPVRGRGPYPSMMPQRAHALRVAPIFGPRYVAKLVRSTAATACAWLLAIFRKLTQRDMCGFFNSLLGGNGLFRAVLFNKVHFIV